jgi:hypothetical protein
VAASGELGVYGLELGGDAWPAELIAQGGGLLGAGPQAGRVAGAEQAREMSGERLGFAGLEQQTAFAVDEHLLIDRQA